MRTIYRCIQCMYFCVCIFHIIIYILNDPKCAELGWRCVPLAVETYCNWGEEARRTFTLLATRLAFGSSSFRKAVISDMFGRLNIKP